MQVSSSSLGDITSTIKTIKRIASATLLVSGFLLLTGILTNTFLSTQAQEPSVIDIAPLSGGSISITSSNSGPCTSFNTGTGQLNVDVQRGGIASDCIAIAVQTDGEDGYTLTINGPASGNLTTSTNETIGATTGTMEEPAVFTNLFSHGAWGFAVPNGQIRGLTLGFDTSYTVLPENNTTNTARFAKVPTTPSYFSVTDAPNTTPHQYHIFLAISAGANMPTGDYSGLVTISATINTAPPPLLLMQEITQLNCPTERTMAVDARDNRTYWVQRLPDGRCWMLTNLAYGGGGNNTFGDVMPIGTTAGTLTAGTSAPGTLIAGVTGVGQVCRGDNASLNTHGRGCFWEPVGSNPTTSPTAPSLSTDGTGQFGFLYNWCAAMGGQAAACQTTAATPADPSINICPAGWRLPTGEPTTGEFTLLNTAINGGLLNTDQGLRENWLGMRTGFFFEGSFGAAGILGGNKSSTFDSATGSRVSAFLSNSSNPSSSAAKGEGIAVRCVSDTPLIQDVTLENCPLERTMVRDARDNRTYWIRRINNTRQGGGDLCWMETNLAYAGGGNNQFGDVMPIGTTPGTLTAGTSAPGTLITGVTGAGQACRGDNPSLNTHGRGCFWEPFGSNPTTSPNAPSTATDGGVSTATRQFGLLYNWCAAMGGQPDACQTTVNVQPDQSVTICPAGWRLPTGDQNVGEFDLLNNAINSGGAASMDQGLRENGLAMRSGSFGNGFLSLQGNVAGDSGYLWSSTFGGGGNANSMWLTSWAVIPHEFSHIGSGFAIRCVRD